MRIAVVGGGAAGFFAALNTAEKNRNARITIFEAAHKPLQKVFISGGGRCNLTHACFDPTRLTEFYPRGQQELRSLFSRFQPRDTMTWFENHGLILKTEEDNRVFPACDSSQAVIDLFMDVAEKYRIRVRPQTRVEHITPSNGGFEIQAQGKTEQFDVCILSTGYSPPGWKLAESLGHTVTPPVPSLFPFTVKSPVIAGLQGISLPVAQGKLDVAADGKSPKLQAEGALLITHTGLSGPLIYRLSAWGAQALAKAGYKATLQLDLIPALDETSLRDKLNQIFLHTEAKKKLGNTGFDPIPHRLWLSLLAASGANLEERCEVIGKKSINRLIEHIKYLKLPVSGKSPSKEEFVSCGGVALKEVDFKTMQSRLVPNLYFGGEILNIDGLTGGFNFQACWSEGWTISEALKAQN
ncbi:MAG: flavoprotein family [Vampirovibrio sp.]|nr:flavoprotein family [Vampirovibrio sp.]